MALLESAEKRGDYQEMAEYEKIAEKCDLDLGATTASNYQL